MIIRETSWLTSLIVKSLIIERYHTRLAAPKAHVISGRTMELCRQYGLDMNELRRQGTKREDAYWVNFVTSLQGHWVASFPFERYDPEVLEQTPAVSFYIIRFGLVADFRCEDGS